MVFGWSLKVDGGDYRFKVQRGQWLFCLDWIAVVLCKFVFTMQYRIMTGRRGQLRDYYLSPAVLT